MAKAKGDLLAYRSRGHVKKGYFIIFINSISVILLVRVLFSFIFHSIVGINADKFTYNRPNVWIELKCNSHQQRSV